MDHIPKSSNPTLCYPRVPLVCKDFSEDVEFLEYPATTGWEKLVPARGMRVTVLGDITDLDEIARLETLLQGWIFFGLLREALGPFKLYSREDYLEADDQGKIVHTKGLIPALEEISCEGWDKAKRIELGDHLERCMRYVVGVFYSLVNINIQNRLQPGIWMSVLSICETVQGICDIHLERSPESISQTLQWTSVEKIPLSDSLKLDQLVKVGWCPSEIASCESNFASIHGRMYLRGMSRDDLGLDHGGCKPDTCGNMQIDMSTYQPKHLDQACACELVGPDRAAVAACLKDGNFPLLRIDDTDSGKMTLDVVPFNGGEPYVALSHVWADGLGNPVHTMLPSCQIAAISELIHGLHGRTFTWGIEGSDSFSVRQETRDLLFWCDTLCCPTVPASSPTDEEIELKATAIAKLRDVYEGAEYVLVLDQSLRTVDSGTTDQLEQIIRVFTCRWIKRLWTFQEAALAKKLLFVFADRVIDFRELWQHTTDLYKTSPAHHMLCRTLCHEAITLRSWRDVASSDQRLLVRLNNAVHHRRVSVPSDEPICLATALGLDVKKVSTAEAGTRMEVMWKLLFESGQGVPDDIVFCAFQRLPTAGFRWAPSTFLVPYSSEKTLMTWEQGTAKALWTPDGVKIRRTGWQIEVDWPHVGAEVRDQAWAQQDKDSLIIRAPNGQWYVAGGIQVPNGVLIESIMGLLQTYRSQKWFLILDEEVSPGRRGLLTVAEDRPEGRVYISVCLLYVSRSIPFVETFSELGYEHSEMIKRRYPKKKHASMATLERMARMFVAWMPAGHERFPLALIQEVFAKAQKHLADELAGLIKEYGQRASETLRARAAIQDAGQTVDSSIVMAHVFKCYFNGHARVTRAFDASHEWCID